MGTVVQTACIPRFQHYGQIPDKFPSKQEPREILQMCLKSQPFQRASIYTLEWHPYLQIDNQVMAADSQPEPRM